MSIEGLSWARSGGTSAEKCMIVVSHLFLFVFHLTDIYGTVYTRDTFFNIVMVWTD